MDWATFFLILQFFYVVGVILFILAENRDPEDTLLWLIILLGLPYLGFIVFFFFGRDLKNGNKVFNKRKKELDGARNRFLSKFYIYFESFHQEFLFQNKNSWFFKVARLTEKNNDSPVFPAKKIIILPSGELGFLSLLKDLRGAKRFIHLHFFIWERDDLTNEIIEILIKKVREGVEVRVMYDFLGSLLYSKKELNKLKRTGGKVFAGTRNFTMLNYRNHRKIAVIDGEIGYTGGINIGEEYITGGNKYPYWRDTFVRLEGQIVSQLENLFSEDWFERTKENLWSGKYMPILKDQGDIPCQLSYSATYYFWQSTKQAYLNAILNAKKKVYIQSPYFIPDRALAEALETASLSGVDVRLIMTGWPDKKSAWWAAGTFFDRLLKAGMRIYYYEKGFYHTKGLGVDEEFVSIGSTNFDVRSFALNNENTVFIYQKETADEFYKIFDDDLRFCREYTLSDYKKLSKKDKIRNSIAKVFSNLF